MGMTVSSSYRIFKPVNVTGDSGILFHYIIHVCYKRDSNTFHKINMK